jgi:hypothetical protein
MGVWSSKNACLQKNGWENKAVIRGGRKVILFGMNNAHLYFSTMYFSPLGTNRHSLEWKMKKLLPGVFFSDW